MKIRLNIGCGKTPTPGWYNFDNSLSLRLASFPKLTKFLHHLHAIDNNQLQFALFAESHKIRHINAAKKIPFQDHSVDVIYSSHMLEHLDRNEVTFFLGEARRVLRHGGIIRLVLPNLQQLIDSYIEHQDADKFIQETHLCQNRPINFSEKIRLLLMGPRNHQWMYDKKSLYNLLTKTGFTEVEILNPGETSIPNPGKLNLLERQFESMYIEAINP